MRSDARTLFFSSGTNTMEQADIERNPAREARFMALTRSTPSRTVAGKNPGAHGAGTNRFGGHTRFKTQVKKKPVFLAKCFEGYT